MASHSHFGGICVKNTLIMGLSVIGEKLYHLGVNLIAVLLAGGDSHSYTAKGLEGALEGLIRLKAHYLLQLLIKIARFM